MVSPKQRAKGVPNGPLEAKHTVKVSNLTFHFKLNDRAERKMVMLMKEETLKIKSLDFSWTVM